MTFYVTHELFEIAEKRMDFHFDEIMKARHEALEMYHEQKLENTRLRQRLSELENLVDRLYNHLAPDLGDEEVVWECPVQEVLVSMS